MTPYFRITVAVLAIIGGSMLAYAASAQEPRQATLTFERPTKYTDDSDIPASQAITYRVYQGARGPAKVLVGDITETNTTINSGLLAGLEYCWEVTAVINGEESAHSNEACKSFKVSQPIVITVR